MYPRSNFTGNVSKGSFLLMSTSFQNDYEVYAFEINALKQTEIDLYVSQFVYLLQLAKSFNNKLI